MERIWSPWRIQYIRSPEPAGCIFCDKPKELKDEANHILFHGHYNFVIMNAFPYNPGHLLVVPYRHIGVLEDMTEEERNEHYRIVSRWVGVLRAVTGTANFNIGMNLGRVAGAGIADHIHTHIVPRWNGDNNFMPVIGETRVISESMADIYRKLLQGLSLKESPCKGSPSGV
ncbi:MAG TPA: HIT domain-containing protein [Dehalococcoidales bacterium]|nr:HIT domain-containing protein [Dehalococcoidales bacterium]